MAILPTVPGLKVTVRSFNQDLPEYVDQTDWTAEKWAHVPEHQRASTYVECQSGAEFVVLLSIEPPFTIASDSITIRVSVDGIPICQRTEQARYLRSCNGYLTAEISKVVERISPTLVSRRPLKFGSLQKVDDSDSARVQRDAKAISDVGNIEVTIFRTCDALIYYDNSNQIQGTPSEIAEKALKGKAISNHVVYGEPVVQTYTSRDVILIDGNKPIALFNFRYRSREDLQAEMIIPRSPSPPPIASSSMLPNIRANANSISNSRTARLANLKREIEEIKAEEEEERGGPSNKRHNAGSRAYKTSQGADGKVTVDLTDDD